MSGRAAVSPGGQLLRSSRLFSVPKPLPEPTSANLNIGTHKSLTMTKPYPSHQAFTTPKSSRENGDWGFKRPFPLKSTANTSTPLIRVKQVDTVENVTDFASASDLSLTLEKFQEMRIAPLLPKAIGRDGIPIERRQGVFEEHLDVTDLKPGEGSDRKWKFRGPWLARMDEGSFERFLMKKVRPQRMQFRAMLKQKMVEERNRAQAARALDEGEAAPEPITLSSISDADFTEYLRILRADRAKLYNAVADFLDLAPLTKPVGIVQTLLNDYPAKESPFGITGAPQTHPSAGLGYLRTNSFLENHPVFGPQAHRTPVQARIVSPSLGGESAKIGVGGMVADVPGGNNSFNVRRRARGLEGMRQLDILTKGGAKVWVEPEGAVVDPSGSVVLQIKEANAEAQLVAQERNKPGKVYHDSKSSSNPTGESQRMRRVADEMLKRDDAAVGASTVKRTEQWYGLGQ